MKKIRWIFLFCLTLFLTVNVYASDDETREYESYNINTKISQTYCVKTDENLGNEVYSGQQPQISPRKIIGADNRRKIDKAEILNVLSYHCTCFISVKWPNGKTNFGTATIINNGYILTAAHMIYNEDKGGYIDNMIVYPARTGNYIPYGAVSISGEMYIPSSYKKFKPSDPTTYTYQNYDIAIVAVNFHDGPIGLSLDVGVASDAELLNNYLEITGYPQDKLVDGVPYMYTASGHAAKVDGKLLEYQIDTVGGNSGGAIVMSRNNREVIVGVHSRAYTSTSRPYNAGVRIDKNFLTWIKNHAYL